MKLDTAEDRSAAAGEYVLGTLSAEEQQAFAQQVKDFCNAHDDIDIFDVTRENMAQIVDTPKRRAFMKEIGHKGWLGMTWPKEYGGRGATLIEQAIFYEENVPAEWRDYIALNAEMAPDRKSVV